MLNKIINILLNISFNTSGNSLLCCILYFYLETNILKTLKHFIKHAEI